MTETAMSFTRVDQEFHGGGARHEQLRQVVHNGLMQQMEDFKARLEIDEARVTQMGQEGDRFSHDTCTSIKLRVQEAKDMREMIQNLAQQVEVIRSGTNPGAASSGHNSASEPVSSENSVPVALEINDLKKKVARLIEQVDQHISGNWLC